MGVDVDPLHVLTALEVAPPDQVTPIGGGWDTLINKSSTTWRQLPPTRKAPGSDAEWQLLLKEHPQLIRRPVVAMDDGTMTQGFSDNGFKKLFGVVK